MIIGPGVNIQSGVNMVVPQDQFFPNETLLLSYGPNVAPAGDAQSFTQDASTNNFAVTISGDAKNETFNPFYPDGYWSNYFVASNDRLTLPAAIGNLGSSFCVEFFYYPTVASGAVFVGTAGSGAFQFGWRSTTEFGVASTGVEWLLTSTPTVPTLNAWNHIVFIRTGTGANQSSLYINGTRVAVGTVSTAWNTNLALSIGSAPDNSAGITGWLSNVRIVNGSTLPYDQTATAITQPTAPLTAITGTSLLTCQSNRFVDNSTNASSITVSGPPEVTVTEPFGFRLGTAQATVPNSSAITSGYSSTFFNGTTDYLTTATSRTLVLPSNQNFTVEAWVYLNSLAATTQIVFFGNGTGAWTSTYNIDFGVLSTGFAYVEFSNGTSTAVVLTGGTTITTGRWIHLAWVYNGTAKTITSYVNGAVDLTGSSMASYAPPAASVYATIGRTDPGVTTPTNFLNGYVSNLRVVKNTQVYTGAFTVPTAPLGLTQSAGTNISAIANGQTVFLLNGTTYGNNKNYIDSSTNNFGVTVNGNPSQTPISPYYGNNYSMLVTTSDSIAVPNINFASNNFTIEGWYYFTGTTFAVGSPALTNFWGTSNGAGVNPKLILSADATNLTLLNVSTVIVQNAHGMVPNFWYHVAVVRTGTSANQVFIYVNGTAINTTSTALGSLSGITGTFNIGFAGEAYGTRFQGYISNFRVVNGTALYTSAFTPSTTPLTNISNTFLLTCQSSRLVDNSNFGATITSTGTPVISQFIPFNVTYSAALYGGSMYCAATSDFVSFAPAGTDSFGTGDFTVECWLNPLAATAVNLSLPSANTNTWGLLTFGGQLYWQENGSNLGGAGYGTVVQQAWNHLAVCRSGTTIRWFVNGVQVNSATNSFNYSGAPATRNIGPGSGGSAPALISNFRIVRGTALYTGSFTPPTAPLTAVTNTSLLLNTNNVNTYDLTLSNPVTNVSRTSQDTRQPFAVPTVGITYTAVSTFGSAYFDGTGDQLSIPYNFILNPSSGINFTAECWVYCTARSSVHHVMGMNSTTLVNWRISDESGSWNAIIAGTGITGSAVVLGTWTHLALVQLSNNVLFFVNGVQQGSTTSISSWNTNNLPFTISGRDGGDRFFTGYISNVRVVKGTAVYATNFTPPAVPLTAIPATNLLTLQQDGPAKNNSFIDSSANNLLVTRNGNTTQGSFTPYWPNGYWSNYFNGSTDYLTVPSNAAFTFGTGDFTIEFWFNGPPQLDKMIYDNRGATSTGYPHITTGQSTATLRWGPTNTSSSAIIADNTWHHCAVTRQSGTIRLWVDGVQSGSASDTTNYSINYSVFIGSNSFTPPATVISGYISNLRVINGTALYTTNFARPTVPLTVTANTSLLICQSNRFRDNSVNNFTVTASGTPSSQRFQPFSPPAAYSPIVYGASAYFDGTGDFLQTAATTLFDLSGDFTIELWAYFTSLSGNRILLERWASTTSGTWQLYYRSTGTSITWFVVDTVIVQDPSATTIAVNTWNHIAVSRSGTTVRLFINGVQVGSATNSNTLTNAQPLGVGRQLTTGTNDFAGYMCDVRITRSALYTANFTLPTAPLQPVANTQYLLNANNAAIYDRTGNNDLDTVGNTQTVTNVRRLGAGCMYFDGNGDYLTAPTGDVFRFPGDFTIEFWANPSSFAIVGVLFDTRSSGTSTTGIRASFGTDGRLNYFADNATRITSSAAYSTGTWIYVAIVRASGVTTMYVNGSSVGTYSATTNYSDGNLTIGTTIDNRAATTTLKYNGYLDNFQITKSARYTTNFTVPVDNPIYQ